MRNLGILAFSALIALSQTSNTVVAADAELLSLNCNGCHGPDGVSAGKSIPSIAGLEYRYFMRTMLKFRKGERASTIMGRIARGYKVPELRNISKYFASLEWRDTAAVLDGDKVRKGHEIHDELCEECHEKNGRHQDKDIPRISGQLAEYLYLQMLDYHAGIPTMPQPDKMKERMETLKKEDLEALSLFYASGT
jgi:sulfide dehydrogenase cytochrome subunit